MHRRKFIAVSSLLAGTAIAGCRGSANDDAPDSGDPSGDKTTDGDGGNQGEPTIEWGGRGSEDVEMQADYCNSRNEPTYCEMEVPPGAPYVIFGGDVRVPAKGYKIIIDDVSYESDSGTLTITTDYERHDESGRSCDNYGGALVKFKQEGTIQGPAPSAVRLDVRDIDGLQTDATVEVSQ